MRHMVLVAEHELQGVLARRQGDIGFSLAGAEMQMLKVVGYFGVEWGRRRVDDQVMMT